MASTDPSSFIGVGKHTKKISSYGLVSSTVVSYLISIGVMSHRVSSKPLIIALPTNPHPITDIFNFSI